MILRSVAILLASLVVTTGAAEEKWWPSQWGADDELGAFNMLGSELTLKAAKLIKTGKTYRLGIETNHDTPAYPPRTFDLNVLMPNQYNSTSYGNNKFSYADDIIAGWLGIGSQIDGLGHVATDGVFYNGKHGKDFIKADGLTMFGLESLPPIVSRGVMLDMAACMGHQMLSEGTAFNRAEIVACEKQQGVTIEKGDVVLFNTGWMNIIGSEPARFIDKEPGLGVDGRPLPGRKGGHRSRRRYLGRGGGPARGPGSHLPRASNHAQTITVSIYSRTWIRASWLKTRRTNSCSCSGPHA